MKNKQLHETKLLKEIIHEFSIQRQNGPVKRRGYPKRLRKLVLSAVDVGHRLSRVTDAAGISRQTLMNWQDDEQKESKRTPPMELQLVKEQRETGSACAVAQNQNEQKLRIHFRSGAIMEIPISSFNAPLVAALNGNRP